jgi:signal transduction histidine kinase/ligand-binding sensor domain-containing protein
MAARLILFAILPFVLSSQGLAGPNEREAGLPYLRDYTPREYRAQSQNWSVTQDPRGVIYIGNNDGVLVYDGVRWHTVRVANDSAVRSLDVDSNGVVYVGAHGEFGYLAPDESGSTRYVSLLDRVPAPDRRFTDVWRTIATPDGVYFSSYDRLFRWNPQTGLNVWKPAARDRYSFAFRAGNSLYVQDSRSGLLTLNRDTLHPVPGAERFAKDRIYCVSIHNDKLLVGVKDGMFLHEGGSFKPFPTEADALLSKAQPHSCSALPGGGLVVTTRRGGAVLLTKEARLERVLNENSGLSSDWVTYAYPDREGGLWLSMAIGVARVEPQSPLSILDDRNGLAGSVAAIARHDGTLYAGTTTGLYRLRPGPAGGTPNFEVATDISEEVLSLLSTKAGLLVGARDGVYQLQGKKARLISSDYVAYDLSPSKLDPGLVYAGGLSGLALLRERGGRWSDGGQVSRIDQPIRKAIEEPAGVWLGTDSQGVLLVSGLPGNPSVQAFGAKEGLPAGAILPFIADGRTVFLSTKGILNFDPKSRRFSPDTVLGSLFTGRTGQPTILTQDPNSKNIWVSAKTYGGVLHHQTDGRYQWDETPLRRIGETEIQAVHVDSDGVTWAGTSEEIVRYDPAIPKNYSVRFSALVRRLSDIEEKQIHFGGHGDSKLRAFQHQRNSLRFRFAAPTFEDESRTEYRVRLQGFDHSWSPWTQETRKDYTNLPEGSYVFRVAARNLYGVTGEEAAVAFSVLPPWYRTWWGYGLAILTIAVALFCVVRWRLRRLAEQNRRLQKIVEERTAELREKNSALTQLNSEKNDFMGIAAHDLKNPLGAIRGFAEMLEEDAADMPQEEVVGTAGKIKKSANLMFDLVSNLLDVNRIEQGKMDLTLAPCDLWDTVRQAVEGYRQRALAKQIELHFDENNRPPLVVADANQLVQIMDNLVSNAVKYSPRAKNIWVKVYQVDSHVRAEVRDEGPGISAEDQKRLFGKFARLSARPTGGEHSTGLGLAIVKRLVESMKGEVWCESRPGEGATFIVELPEAEEVLQPKR